MSDWSEMRGDSWTASTVLSVAMALAKLCAKPRMERGKRGDAPIAPWTWVGVTVAPTSIERMFMGGPKREENNKCNVYCLEIEKQLGSTVQTLRMCNYALGWPTAPRERHASLYLDRGGQPH